MDGDLIHARAVGRPESDRAEARGPSEAAGSMPGRTRHGKGGNAAALRLAGPHTCKTARGACLGGPGPGKAGVAESRRKPRLCDSARVGPGGKRQGTSAGDERHRRHGTSAERQENLVSIEPKSTPTPTCVRRPLGKGPRGLISRMDNTGNRQAVSQRDCPAKAGAATLASAGRAKAGADFGQRLVKRERLKERQTPPIFERVRLLLCSVLSEAQMGKNGRANLIIRKFE